MAGVHPLTADERSAFQRDWFEGQPLTDFLPFRAPSGFVVTQIDAECAVCKCPVEPGNLRAQRIDHRNGVVEFRAMGICCRTVTRYLWRFRPTGEFDSLVGHQWRFFRVKTSPPAWWNLAGQVRRLFS